MTGCPESLVLLDSDHTHAHVPAELSAYTSFIGHGQHLICCDTAMNRQPQAPDRSRQGGNGNNPATALVDFLGFEAGAPFLLYESIRDVDLNSRNCGV